MAFLMAGPKGFTTKCEKVCCDCVELRKGFNCQKIPCMYLGWWWRRFTVVAVHNLGRARKRQRFARRVERGVTTTYGIDLNRLFCLCTRYPNVIAAGKSPNTTRASFGANVNLLPIHDASQHTRPCPPQKRPDSTPAMRRQRTWETPSCTSSSSPITAPLPCRA